MLTTADRQVVDRFTAELRARIPDAGVVVFGSRARGDAGPESDLDVLVVVERIDSIVRAAADEAAWLAGFPDIVVAPVLMTRCDLESAAGRRSVFLQTVLREGIAA